MRSDKHSKKKQGGLRTSEIMVLITALLVATMLIAFFAWVIYGDNENKGQLATTKPKETEQKEVATPILDVSEKWSVPASAFKGANGDGKFESDGVKNKMDLDKLYQEMGVEEKSKKPADQKRVEAVKRFLDGLYYEAEPTESLSNGSEVMVTIQSTEDITEIESEANIEIEGVGESKKVTVSGLVDKFSIGELAAQGELIQAAKETAEQKIRESDAGNHEAIFSNMAEYNATLTYYGTFIAKPEDNAEPDALIVLYRLTSTYPDSGYTKWTQDGDYVYTYEMTHFENITKETTVADIQQGLKYDTFRYENDSLEVLDYYRNNLSEGTTYVINRIG